MSRNRPLARHALSAFFVTSLGFSALVAWVSFSTGNEALALLIPLSPSVIAIGITLLAFGRRGLGEMFRGRFIGRLNLRWSLVAAGLFPLLAAAALWVHSLFGGPNLALRTTTLMPQIVIILLISLGEEIGWRGFALPRLQKRYSALTASLVLGVAWGFWHYPGFLVGTGVPLDLPFHLFLLWVMLATILMTWVYNNTGGSMLSAIIMHSAANASFNYLPLLPEWAGQRVTFLIFLALVTAAVVAVIARSGATRLRRGVSTVDH